MTRDDTPQAARAALRARVQACIYGDHFDLHAYIAAVHPQALLARLDREEEQDAEIARLRELVKAERESMSLSAQVRAKLTDEEVAGIKMRANPSQSAEMYWDYWRDGIMAALDPILAAHEATVERLRVERDALAREQHGWQIRYNCLTYGNNAIATHYGATEAEVARLTRERDDERQKQIRFRAWLDHHHSRFDQGLVIGMVDDLHFSSLSDKDAALSAPQDAARTEAGA